MSRSLKTVLAAGVLVPLLLGSAALAGELCELRAVVGLHKPPYIFEASDDGLEQELFGAAMRAAKCSVHWTHAPPARALVMLRQGETDVMLTLRETALAPATAFFSQPYIAYNNVAISLASLNARLDTIEDLANYRTLAFQNARLALGERYRAAVAKAPHYQEVAQQITQVRMLFSGRAQVIVGDRRILEYLRQEVAAEANSQIRTTAPISIHELFDTTEYRAAFADSAMRDRFDQGLAQIRANGSYARIIARYRPAAPAPERRTATGAADNPPPLTRPAKKSVPASP